ncbi:MAG: hypothetical protein JKY50_15465 [Oleispira sp.]|nr:hypothetical protein [Oleispira sp.]MBL4882187.1 hypothetical protein [Oleispira sp.]
MLINKIKKGVTLKFPLSVKFSTTVKNVEECSVDALPLALTIIDSDRTTAAKINFMPHTPGGVNYYETNGDVMSGNFTGCVMSTYQVGGKRRVAHVHTGTDAGPNRCCKTFMKGLIAQPSHTSLNNFKPFDGARDVTKATAICVSSSFGANGCVTFGLVTAGNKPYSILTRKIGSHEFLVEDVIDQSARSYQFV